MISLINNKFYSELPDGHIDNLIAAKEKTLVALSEQTKKLTDELNELKALKAEHVRNNQ